MTYHLAGDSTVAPMKPTEAPMSGWGGFLGEIVDADVRNLAFGGATTETFLASGTWTRLLDSVTTGDTVLLQFGHNDQKEPALLAARDGFRTRLVQMISTARARRATVILCTPCERRHFAGGILEPSHGDYPNAVRDLARDFAAPLIDLTAFTTWLYTDLGEDASRSLFSHFAPGEVAAWPEGLADDTHFRAEGARRIAAFVGQSVRAIERRGGDKPVHGATGA